VPFQLWRQDDNGGKFLIDCYPTLDLAEAAMAVLSRVPHKQFYWIEAVEEAAGRNPAES